MSKFKTEILTMETLILINSMWIFAPKTLSSSQQDIEIRRTSLERLKLNKTAKYWLGFKKRSCQFLLNKFCTHTRHTLNKTSRYRSPIGKNRLSRTYFPRAIILNNVSEQIFLYLGCPFFYKYRSMSCKRKYIDPLTRTCWTTSHFINRIYKVFIFRGYVPMQCIFCWEKNL